MKSAIYLRVSTEEQDEENQMESCVQFCKDQGYELVGTFRDHAKSVYRSVKREHYEELMQLVYQKKIQHIVVWALDRWCRTGGEDLLKSISLLNSYGVNLHSVQEQFVDEYNIPGEIGIHVRNFVIGILGWQAKQESLKKSNRVKESKKFQRAKKKHKVGRPKISQEVKQKVIELLRQGKSYGYIHNVITYKAKYGKVKHISIASIGDINKVLSKNGDSKLYGE